MLRDLAADLAADLAGTMPAKVAAPVANPVNRAEFFILPMANPGEYHTSYGVPGSRKLSMFYKWLNARGISLVTMSTDECVLAALPRLRAAASDLDAAIAHVKAGGKLGPSVASLPDLEFTARALAGLMTRIPANRVGG